MIHRNSVAARVRQFAVPAVLIAVSVCLAALACARFSVVRSFRNPIAYCVVNDFLYVVEKENNTVLKFEYEPNPAGLRLRGAYRLEPDDAERYYMVRKLSRGRGLVTQSYIYRRDTGDFVGYRFSEYPSGDLTAQPVRLFTVFLEDPKSYPEMDYAFGGEGRHYMINNCIGRRNIWRMPPGGGTVMAGGRIPEGVIELGETNHALSSWTSACVGPDGNIVVASAATDQVVEYSDDGRRIREIGSAGFEKGDLLAPDGLSFPAMEPGAPALLMVASMGNRTWVQFAGDGRPARTICPLDSGYPFEDIHTGAIYVHEASGDLLAFDLVNKCLVVLNKDYATISTFRARQAGKTCLLCGASLLLFLLAVAMIRKIRLGARPRFPFVVKLLILFVPLLAFSAFAVGDMGVMEMMKADLEAEYVRRSANLARAIVNTVSLSDLESIRLPEDREGEAYRRIFDAVSGIMDARDVEYTPKWIIHKIRDGRFYFGINVWRGPIYEPFIVPRERRMFFEALEQKACRFGRFTDEQGEWFSYLCPIVNSDGEAIYVIELYRPTEDMDRIERKAQLRIAEIAGGTALAAAVLAVAFAYFFTRPLRKLSQAAGVVSKGNFEHRIELVSRDELGDLAEAFNMMVADLKQYTVDLARATAEKERIQSELRFAREIQQGILPRNFPPFPRAANVEICARIEPAREVGGDYYDFFLVDDDHIGVVIADVSGKGMSAGLFMMIVRTLLRSSAAGNLSAADALSRTNRIIAGDNPTNMFATVLYFIFDMRTGRMKLCNAGHNLPFVLGRRDGLMRAVQLRCAGGPILGATEEARYSESELALEAGESIILYTDGVTEPLNKQGEMFGVEALERRIQAGTDLPNKEICENVYRDVAKHQEGLEQFDDITILLFKYLSGCADQNTEKS